MATWIRTILSVCLIISVSCRKKEESHGEDEARELFKNSIELISKYTEDIKLANDSSSVDSLYKDFEKEISNVNFSFPPETDFKLSEQENDSIFDLLLKLNLTRKVKLESLNKNVNDSIPLEEEL